MKRSIQLVALLLTVFMGSCTGGKDKAAAEHVDAKPIVKLADVKARPVDQIQDYTATVEAEVKNNIAPSSPVRIDQIFVEVGDRVSKGQKLVQMDAANLKQTKLQLDNQEIEFSRIDELYKVGGASKSEWDASKMQLDVKKTAYKNLLEKLYEAGCRYVQFEGVKSILTDEAARLNNRVLRERPEGLFVAFHAATDMLIRLHGADAYFLNYDCGICDRSRLLWFVREREAVFGFVLSYYPDEEELDELQAKMEEVLNYIPVKHLTLCLPDADNLLNSSEEDEVKQWKTVELAKDMAARIFFA